MLKKLFSLTALVVLCCAFSFADQWNKSFTVTGTPQLTVHAGDGNIHIEPWDKNEISIEVTTVGWHIGGNGVHIDAHQNWNNIDLDVALKGIHITFSSGINKHRIDIEVRMPKEAKLDLNTSDGSIRMADMKGEFHLQTGDGRLVLENLDGSLDAHSGDGAIEARGRFDRLDLRTNDGSIRATVLAGSRMAGPWSFRSGDGSIHLALPRDISAELQMHTGDGHIHSDLPLTVQGSLDKHTMHGKLNGGGELMTLRTGDGSIELQQL